MKRTLSPHELEQLSAYLDNQLPPAEQARLAARLADEPALRAELAELRATVAVLRALPRLKVPRNFTLTPAQVRTSRRWSLPSFGLPALRLATALAAVAFVLVFALDLTAGRQPAALAPLAQRALTAETPLPAPAAALPGTRVPGEQPVETAAPRKDVPPSFSPEAGGGQQAGTGGGGAESGQAGGVGGGPAASPTQESPPPMQLQAGEAITESVAPAEDQTEAPTPTEVAALPQDTAVPAPESMPRQGGALPPVDRSNPYRPATVGLALLTGLLAMTTLLLRRNR